MSDPRIRFGWSARDVLAPTVLEDSQLLNARQPHHLSSRIEICSDIGRDVGVGTHGDHRSAEFRIALDDPGCGHGFAQASSNCGGVDLWDDVGCDAGFQNFVHDIAAIPDVCPVCVSQGVSFAEIHMGEYVEPAGSVSVELFTELHGFQDGFQVFPRDRQRIAIFPCPAFVDGVSVGPVDAEQDEVEVVIVEEIDDFGHVVRLIAHLDALPDEDLMAELLAKLGDGLGISGVVVPAVVNLVRVGIVVLGEGQPEQPPGDGSLDIFDRVSL